MILSSDPHPSFSFSLSFRAGRYDSTDRHCKNCSGYSHINKGKGAFPVVITRAQYNSIQHYRMAREDGEGGQQATDQSTEQADVQIRTVLADVFKNGLPDWFPSLNNLGVESSSSGAIMDPTAQLPTSTASVAIPVSNNVEQPSPYEPSLFEPNSATITSLATPVSNSVEQPSHYYEPSLFDPDSANEGAEAFTNGFPAINLEGTESNNSGGAVMDVSAQLSAMSVPDPVSNHFKQQSPRYELSLFDPETANECAEALTDVFTGFNQEDELNNVAQSSTSVSPVPVAQSEFYTPPLFDMERVEEWGSFLSGFS